MSGLSPVDRARSAAPYVSCMKINGIPLLPPILDTESRREMQYYRLLALEVEKQIKLLKPLAAEKTSSTICVAEEDDPDLEICSEINDSNDFEDFDTYITTDKALADISSSLTAGYQEDTNTIASKYYKVVEVEVENIIKCINNKKCKTPNKLQDMEIPERDHNSPRSLREKISPRNLTDPNKENAVYFSESNVVKDLFPDEPTSLSSKSFTGSLNNINYEVSKDSSNDKKLTRQSSYTLLQPSPQLLAHLTTQSMNTGLEMSAISMTDNDPNSPLISPTTKRRKSWDLETAKVQWSSMALELQKKSSTTITKKPRNSPYQTPQNRKKTQSKTHIKSGQQKSEKNKENVNNSISSHTIILDKEYKRTAPNTPNKHKSKSVSPNRPHGNTNLTISDDPSIKVRELYDKMQKHQMQQMSALIEKQKQEKRLLQQLFEDQNNLLYRQLKNICPSSPIEAKQAWTDKSDTSSDRGPVSLSQLIKDKSPPTINITLTDTSNYISHCDQVLKKSKTITGGLKNSITSKNDSNRSKTPLRLEGSRTRNTSPVDSKKAHKKLVYENSEKDAGSLTDRTNDTLADINDSFPSDDSLRVNSRNNNNTVINMKEFPKDEYSTKTDNAIKNMMEDLQKSLRETKEKRSKLVNRLPTDEELAASSKIVAFAKGFLVRRLMRSERVQFTVQMIKDALLCALQLHQDREDIRGADVDLHRRLIQQITAACYNLHETFITSSPQERCRMIAADRARRHALAMRQTPPPRSRNSDLMSQSYSGTFPARAKRSSLPVNMTRSNHEAFSDYKSLPRRRPWR